MRYSENFQGLFSCQTQENGRPARKVPLFSKNWGDCLTIWNVSGNI